MTPAAAPAPAPAATQFALSGAAPADRFLRSTAASVLRYIRAGPIPPQTPYNLYMQEANRTASRDGLVLTAVCAPGSEPELQRPGYCRFYLLVPLSSLPGLILSIVGLNQIKKQGGKGKGLAIAGIIIISAAGMVIQVILVIALIVGGVSYTSKAIDERRNPIPSIVQSSSATVIVAAIRAKLKIILAMRWTTRWAKPMTI